MLFRKIPQDLIDSLIAELQDTYGECVQHSKEASFRSDRLTYEQAAARVSILIMQLEDL